MVGHRHLARLPLASDGPAAPLLPRPSAVARSNASASASAAAATIAAATATSRALVAAATRAASCAATSRNRSDAANLAASAAASCSLLRLALGLLLRLKQISTQAACRTGPAPPRPRHPPAPRVAPSRAPPPAQTAHRVRWPLQDGRRAARRPALPPAYLRPALQPTRRAWARRRAARLFEDNLHDQSTRRHTSDQTFTLHTRL